MIISSISSGFAQARGELLVLVVKAPEDRRKEKGKDGKKEKHIIKSLSSPFLSAQICNAMLEKLQREEYKAGHLEVVSIGYSPDPRFKAILLVGWDRKKKGVFEVCSSYRRLGSLIHEHAEKLRLRKVCLAAEELELKEASYAQALLEGLSLTGYRFSRYKSEKDPEFSGVEELCVAGKYKIPEKVSEEARLVSEATIMARDLINTPPCDCTPSFLVEKCREIAKNGKLQIKIFDKAQLEKMGANLLLSVAQGSNEPPYLVKMTYSPAGRPAKVISLVGKGITFDSGGLSLKPAGYMDTMKCDMSGAAAVMGAMRAIAALKPKCEVRAYLSLSENMIDGKGTKIGDVIKGMSGTTVEIMNTDAEGRLVLADALHLACKEKCDVVIDLATLTGACVVALGNDFAGIFTEDDRLCAGIEDAASRAGERVWRLPLPEEYNEQIKSPVADIKNTGGGKAGAITGALFLKKFVSDAAWAHIDIAGPAFVDSNNGHIRKGGTGFGVRTLVRFITQKR